MEPSVKSGERLKQPVPQFVVIDFDRTMGNTSAIMSRLYGVAEAFGINTADILKAQKTKEGEGGSFDPLENIREALGNDEGRIKEFKEVFIADGGNDVFYPDVKPFLKELDDNQMEYGVLTYGESQEWQEWKLAASGYQGKVIVTQSKDKGAQVAKWRMPEGGYEITYPGHDKIRADSVCVIDDRKIAFAGLPSDGDAFGYWLQRSDASPSSKVGELPPGVDIRKIGLLSELEVNKATKRLVMKQQITN